MSVVDLLPRHAQVLLDIEQMVSEMEIGVCLAPERELATQFHVSRETIRRALRTLSQNGILESRQGSGTFVRRHPEKVQRRETPTQLIGLSVPTVEWPTIAPVVSGAEEAAAQAGYRVILSHDHGKPDLQAEQIRGMLDQGVNGLIAFLDQDNVSRPECLELFQSCVGRGKKIVLVDRYLPGVQTPCVMADTVRGMYEATQHLIMAGRRRLAVLSWGEQAGIAERNRMTGFQNALRDHGLPEKPVLHTAIGYEDPQNVGAQKAVTRWIKENGGKLPCDAIVCFVDDMALGAFHALQRAGLRVPQDVALVGFDNVFPELYQSIGLELTTVEQPFVEIGQMAVQRLLALLRGTDQDQALKHTLLAPKLIIRKSCGSGMV